MYFTLMYKYTFGKLENEVNSTLLEMRKQLLISEQINYRLQTTGEQPARMYELAKVRK